MLRRWSDRRRVNSVEELHCGVVTKILEDSRRNHAVLFWFFSRIFFIIIEISTRHAYFRVSNYTKKRGGLLLYALDYIWN